MCRWLLFMRDLAGNDDLMLTQEFLRPDAERAAAKRVDSSKPAAKSGPDQYSRDRMRLLDVKGLEKRACECYGTVKGHYKRLLSN